MSEPRYAEAARRFGQKYASFDPRKQVERMVARVEEVMEARASGRAAAGVGAGVFAG